MTSESKIILQTKLTVTKIPRLREKLKITAFSKTDRVQYCISPDFLLSV